jgi:hypothetical protein
VKRCAWNMEHGTSNANAKVDHGTMSIEYGVEAGTYGMPLCFRKSSSLLCSADIPRLSGLFAVARRRVDTTRAIVGGRWDWRVANVLMNHSRARRKTEL